MLFEPRVLFNYTHKMLLFKYEVKTIYRLFNCLFNCLFMVLIASIILTANLATTSYAAINNANTISPMYVPCPNCKIGRMITTSESHTYHDHYDVCSVRNDCIITVTRTETNYETHCSDCGYGTKWIGYDYKFTHSKSH